MIRLMGQNVIHLLLGKSVLSRIVIDPVIVVHAGAAAQIPAVSAVENGIEVREQDFRRKRYTHERRRIAVRHACALFGAAAEDDVIHAAGDGHDSFLEADVARAAAFGMGQ